MSEEKKQEVVVPANAPATTDVVNQSLGLMRVAKGLFQSGLFPNTKNEYGAFAIVQYGHELGIPPMVALQNVNIINGKLCVNGQVMLSKALASGATYKVVSETNDGCSIEFSRNGTTYTSTFDKSDATAAGLIGKDNWKKYPRDMYFWRAVAKGVRRIAPEAIMGLYLPDEINPDLNEVPRTVIDVEAEVVEPETPPEKAQEGPSGADTATPTAKAASGDGLGRVKEMREARTDATCDFCGTRHIKKGDEIVIVEDIPGKRRAQGGASTCYAHWCVQKEASNAA
ncbi:MAG: hypothetical protein ABIH23_26245 [bacterium]